MQASPHAANTSAAQTTPDYPEQGHSQGLAATGAAIAELERELQHLASESWNAQARFNQLRIEIEERTSEQQALNEAEKNRRSRHARVERLVEELKNIQGGGAGLPPSNAMATAQLVQSINAQTNGGSTNASAVSSSATPARAHPTAAEVIVIEDDDEVAPSSTPLPTSLTAASVIHKHFSNIVSIDGRWREIWCRICGMNATADGFKFFNGLAGLRSHYSARHRSTDVPKLQDICNMRDISDRDIERMRVGQEPQDVPIVRRNRPSKGQSTSSSSGR